MGYFDSKYVLGDSTIAAIVGAKFLRAALSHTVKRYNRQVCKREEARRLLGIGRGLLAVFQGYREKARLSGRRL